MKPLYEKWGAIFGLLGALAEIAADYLVYFVYAAIGLAQMLELAFTVIPDALNLIFMAVYYLLDYEAAGIPSDIRRKAVLVRRASLFSGLVLMWGSTIGRLVVFFVGDGLFSEAFYFAASLAGCANLLLLLAISLIVYGSYE